MSSNYKSSINQVESTEALTFASELSTWKTPSAIRTFLSPRVSSVIPPIWTQSQATPAAVPGTMRRRTLRRMMSEEKSTLIEELQLYIQQLQDPDPALQRAAIESMRRVILYAKSSTPIVLKPIKFLYAHYETLIACYQAGQDSDLQKLLVDIISVLASNMLTKAKRRQKETCVGALRIALFSDDIQHVEQILTCCDDIITKKQLCLIIAQHELALKINEKMVQDHNDRKELQNIINNVHLSRNYLAFSRDVAAKADKKFYELLKKQFTSRSNFVEKKKFCLFIADNGWTFHITQEMMEDCSRIQELQHIIDKGKQKTSEIAFIAKDMYKARAGGIFISRMHLAYTFANAFSGAGLGQDAGSPLGKWISMNNAHAKISGAASLGLLSLWDVDSGFAQLVKYFDSNDRNVVAGAVLGVGIVHCGIKSDDDRALGLLGPYVTNRNPTIQIGAIMGLGLAYANTRHERMLDIFAPILSDVEASVDAIVSAAISLGLVYVGSCNVDVDYVITLALLNLSDLDIREPLAKLALPLGLLYLNKQKCVLATLEMPQALSDENLKKHYEVTLSSCAYAGTGNMEQIQILLNHCRHPDNSETHQGPAILGIALIGMTNEIDPEMTLAILKQLLQSRVQNIRQAVPLALGLLCISKPQEDVIGILESVMYDPDSKVAMAAIISLGLIGAGTQNAKIDDMLKDLLSHYSKDSTALFCVRVAIGIVNLGGGNLTLSPYHSDGYLFSRKALAGLITMLHLWLDGEEIILGKYHFVLYFLVLAMRPRWLVTVDADLRPLSVPVRMGEAAEIVFTPVVLRGDRAVLATKKYIPLSPILEGFVILKENPDYEDHEGVGTLGS